MMTPVQRVRESPQIPAAESARGRTLEQVLLECMYQYGASDGGVRVSRLTYTTPGDGSKTAIYGTTKDEGETSGKKTVS